MTISFRKINLEKPIQNIKRAFNFKIMAVFFLFLALMVSFQVKDSFQNSEQIEEERNVVVIQVDFMRADHMPCYGYDRNTTPNICEFADDSLKFENAVSQAGWTHPSVGTFFTSQYPEVHGLKESFTELDDSSKTLAEVFQENGYQTVAFPGLSEEAVGSNRDYQDFQLLPRYGLYQGFDNYSKKGPFLYNNVAAANEWLRENQTGEFFAYIQGYDPIRYKSPGLYSGKHPSRHYFGENYSGVLHEESVLNQSSSLSQDIVNVSEGETLFTPNRNIEREILYKDTQHTIDHYDSELRKADRQVGKLLDNIRRQGLMNDTVVVIQSSHGVYLNDKREHGVRITKENTEGQRVYGHAGVTEAEINVPLIMHLPDSDGEEINKTVGLIDMMPTLIENAGLKISEDLKTQIQGDDIADLKQNHSVFSMGGWGFESMRSGDRKLIVHTGTPHKLFYLENGEIKQKSDRDAMKRMYETYIDWTIQNLDRVSNNRSSERIS